MIIRNSKKSNLLYAALGLTVIVIVFLKSYDDFESDNKLLAINIFLGVFFAGVSTYFAFKAYDKRPLYEIDDKRIFIRRNDLTYDFKNLRFFRHERFGTRYGSFDYIYFYNADKDLVFKIRLTGTDQSVERVLNKIKDKLDKLL